MRFGLRFVIWVVMMMGIQMNAQESPTLRTQAETRGLMIGAAVQSGLLANDSQYAETLSREFDLVATEYETKMCEIQRQQGVMDFRATDAIVAFAEAHDMQVRGHTLLWHQCFPPWLERGTFTRAEAINIMRDHIYTLVGRYKGRIFAWDVVNEAIGDQGGKRRTQWRELVGDDYIEQAFQFAHEADPGALLFYNDYSAEGTNRKANAVYDLVKDFVDRGIPIHGVGLQMHLRIGDVSLRRLAGKDEIIANMRRLGELGLQVHITEMDVRHDGLPTPELLAQQAEDYRQVVEACLTVEACKAIVTWGFTDRYTWIPQFFGNPDAAPLPFDKDYQPKPAYEAMINALTNFQP